MNGHPPLEFFLALLLCGTACADALDDMIHDFRRPAREPVLADPVAVGPGAPGQRSRELVEQLRRRAHEDEREAAGSGSARTRRARVAAPRVPAVGFAPAGVFAIGNDPVAVACRNGDSRPTPGATPRTVTWILPGRRAYVDVASETGHGGYAEDGSRAMFEIMEWSKYVNLPGVPLPPAVKLPLKLISTAGRIGEAAHDAGRRWGERHARSVVDVTVRLPRNRVTVTCLEVQTCAGGTWRDAGVRVMGEEQVSELDPFVTTREGVLGQELDATVKALLGSPTIRQLREAERAYQEHPCEEGSGATPPTASGPVPGPVASVRPPAPARPDCREIRDELASAREELAEALRARDAGTLREQELDRAHRARIRSAEAAHQEALKELRQARSRESRLLENADNVPGNAQASFREGLERARAELQRALTREEQARTALDAARAPTQEEVDLAARLRELGTRIPQLEARVRELARSLAECEAGR